MMRFLIVVLCLLSLGFYVDTPETRREAEREEHRWQRSVLRHYDLQSLRAFLQDQLALAKRCGDVDLGKSRMNTDWTARGKLFVCGDWFFTCDKPADVTFTIRWNYESIKRSDRSTILKGVVLYCQRESKARFSLIKMELSEDEIIVLDA